eukprot:CAMPEP_0169395556 /NCGR_PEP_ID=MMETSP1017-20121227/50708_1 /TAXON_ID=342587 /ORGANISM="Karlodinium micrum, Strain CCMP2283" /LENGTH=48 /DNA_ID= /DNA_START= /DNA_END= /DNA_ORIENTATION=
MSVASVVGGATSLVTPSMPSSAVAGGTVACSGAAVVGGAQWFALALLS